MIKRGRVLGLSKMLIKSLIFAVAGIVAMIVFRFIRKRKALLVKKMEEEEERAENEKI